MLIQIKKFAVVGSAVLALSSFGLVLAPSTADAARGGGGHGGGGHVGGGHFGGGHFGGGHFGGGRFGGGRFGGGRFGGGRFGFGRGYGFHRFGYGYGFRRFGYGGFCGPIRRAEGLCGPYGYYGLYR